MRGIQDKRLSKSGLDPHDCIALEPTPSRVVLP